ncbi:MAG: helix-turn-helix transcriptional regulator [Bacteroidia bacterium]|nr:helix-turn-helix transcriptional regulator [Bacteroidia bacterium]
MNMALIWILHIALATLACVLLMRKPQPARYLYMMLVIGFSHTLYRATEFLPGFPEFTETGTPLSLLYGPLLYFVYRENTRRPARATEILLHCLPFIVTTALYMIWGELFRPAGSPVLLSYHMSCLLALASFLAYPLCIELEKRRYPVKGRDLSLTSLKEQLEVVFVLSALLLGFFIFEASVPGLDFGVNMHVLIFVMLSVAFMLVMRYMYLHSRKTRMRPASGAPVPVYVPAEERKSVRRSYLSDAQLNAYTQTVHEVLRETRLFLNPNLSLELLSRSTGIAQHHLSQVFNVHECKNFYRFVAEYRIAYAEERMKADGTEELTIESLAYECGFNSKTSFNQYFKAQTGFTPSEYRERCAPVPV